MTVATGDVLRITAKMSLAGGAIQNVYHVLNFALPEDDSVVFDALAAELDDAYSEYTAYDPDAHLYDTIQMWNVTQDAPIDEQEWPVLTAGGSASDVAPLQLCGLVLFSTATARSQGRKYYGPFTEAAQSSAGYILAGVVYDLGLIAAHFLTATVAGDAQFAWGNWNNDLGRFASWQSATVQPLFRTQRRRVPGVGS